MITRLLILLFTFCLFTETQAKPYNDTLARLILPLASAAYAPNPTPCLKNSYANVDVVARYEPLCDTTTTDTCSGYLALIHSERVIAVVFRGTTTDLQLQLETVAAALSKGNFENMGGVNRYFFDGFWAVWRSGMARKFDDLVKSYPNYGLWVTGHSLGAALSTLASAKILKDYPKFNMDNSAHYNYGQPRVGDTKFSKAHDQLIPDFFRVSHGRDLVTVLPPTFYGFTHHQAEVWYNNAMANGDEPIFCVGEGDPLCSGPERDSWPDHRTYFGTTVPEFAKLHACKA